MIELAGKAFGQLVVLGYPLSENGVSWLCKCSCGAEVRRKASALLRRSRKGVFQSCGCLKRQPTDDGVRRCGKCRAIKPVDCFNRSKASASGRHGHCKDCQKAWRKDNRAKLSANGARWTEANPGRAAELARNGRVRNRAKNSARESARRAAVLMATPSWADQEKIAAFFAQAAAMTTATGIIWTVDHVVPLRSKLVCGLHTEQNLAVVTKKENCSKSNRHWPDMP